MSRAAHDLDLGQYLDRAHGQEWTRSRLRLLVKVPDAEVAARTGRGENAVRLKRTELGIPSACDRRREHRR